MRYLLCLLTLVTITACTQDSYEKGEGTYSQMMAELADAHVNGRVSVLSPLSAKDIKAMKTDPVRIESMWVGKSKKYANLSLYLMTGTTDSDSLKQVLGCRRDALVTNADGTRTLRLTLYHNQGGVPEYYSQRVYLSIPIQGMKVDSIWFTVNTYEGQKILKDCL